MLYVASLLVIFIIIVIPITIIIIIIIVERGVRLAPVCRRPTRGAGAPFKGQRVRVCLCGSASQGCQVGGPHRWRPHLPWRLRSAGSCEDPLGASRGNLLFPFIMATGRPAGGQAGCYGDKFELDGMDFLPLW